MIYFSSNSVACFTRRRYGGRATSEDGRRETRNCCSKAVVIGLHSDFLKPAACEGGRAEKRRVSRKSRKEARVFKRVDKSSLTDVEGRKESACEICNITGESESVRGVSVREVGWVRRQPI
jgi:hypothetical protein